jgi:PhnB protein
MANPLKAKPEGYHTVTPTLVVRDAAKAIEFYKKALGAKERSRFDAPDGRVMHAELQIGDSIVMLGDEMPEMGAKSPKAYQGTPVSFYLYLDDLDAAWKRAIDAGGIQKMPLTEMFWGDRMGKLEDPFGHGWILAAHVKDPTPAEMERGQKEFFAQMEPQKR